MATDETDQDPKLPPDARLGSLEERLEKAHQVEAERTRKAQPDSNYRVGELVLGHLIGAPFGGGLIGWVLDKWFGTLPLFMLSLMFLGFAVGIRNVIRLAKTPPGSGPESGS